MKLRNMTSLYLLDGEGLLCLYRRGSRVANNKYVGACGGHFEDWELNDPHGCILREMKEELGLEGEDLEDLRLRYVTLRQTQGELRQNYYFFARLKTPRVLSSTEGDLRWVPFEEIPGLDMPVSAGHMLLHYLREGRCKDLCYGGITQEDGTCFVPMTEF